MASNKKQHIFHANKVDRIAIVDRPAVPDAQILLYKRRGDDAQEYEETCKAEDRGTCVFPSGSSKVNDGKDHFPINTKKQARAALSYAQKFTAVPPWYDGTLKELQNAVIKAVENKYPDMQVSEKTVKFFQRILEKCRKEESAIAQAEKQDGRTYGFEVDYDFEYYFTLAASDAACQVLEQMYWRSIWNENDPLGEWEISLAQFKQRMLDLIAQIPFVGAMKQESPTVEEVAMSFQRGMAQTLISEGFRYFKSSVWMLVYSASTQAKAAEYLTVFIDAFDAFIQTQTDVLISKQERQVEAEKAGRKLSGSRLARLQEAASVITTIIGEVTPQQEEETEMDEKKLQEFLDKSLAPIRDGLTKVNEVLASKGLIDKPLTEEEKKAKEELEKKAAAEAAEKKQAADKAKAEAEKREADAKADAEKRQKEQDELKSKSASLEKELTEVKGKMEKITKSIEAFEKRTGHKVSLDVAEKGADDGAAADPFTAAMRGK